MSWKLSPQEEWGTDPSRGIKRFVVVDLATQVVSCTTNPTTVSEVITMRAIGLIIPLPLDCWADDVFEAIRADPFQEGSILDLLNTGVERGVERIKDAIANARRFVTVDEFYTAVLSDPKRVRAMFADLLNGLPPDADNEFIFIDPEKLEAATRDFAWDYARDTLEVTADKLGHITVYLDGHDVT